MNAEELNRILAHVSLNDATTDGDLFQQLHSIYTRAINHGQCISTYQAIEAICTIDWETIDYGWTAGFADLVQEFSNRHREFDAMKKTTVCTTCFMNYSVRELKDKSNVEMDESS